MKESMIALVYRGNHEIGLEERPVPKLQEPRDAIVQVTRSTICTSDLHIRDGFVPRAKAGVILGHEFVGEIVEVGEGVRNLRPGDRVAVTCETFCGDCFFCRRGYVNNCEKGGWELGCRIDGGQAEYVRVPFADQGLVKIPDAVSDEDALFLGDILGTGYFGAELADIRLGDTVAILGAGPVGLCAAECVRLFGAGRVVLIDVNPFRLNLAKERGLADNLINPAEQDVEEAVRALTGGRGADSVIEAAGGKNTFQTAWKIARPNAVVSLVALYEEAQVLPLPEMYGKNLIFKTGGADACHGPELMRLIEAGQIDTSLLITHRGPLNEIMEGYRVFEHHLDNCIKWVVTPPEG